MITLCALFFLILYLIYLKAFGADRKHATQPYDEYPFEGYKENKEIIKNAVDAILALDYEVWEIKSFDGLKLHAKFYNFYPNAPVLIFFHGWRSNGRRDALGASKICQEAGVNLLVVDQRAHHDSQGKTITFGVKERYDCKGWIDYTINKFGKDVKIYLFGLSMGAATVLMVNQIGVPKNVRGIICDCGYNSPQGICKEVIKQMKLPPKPIYPIVRLAAKIYGKFDPNEASAVEGAKKCNVPVLFMHGGKDDFVPTYMSRENFEACPSKDKTLIIYPNSVHCMSYFEDTAKYENAVKEMLKK